MKKNILFTNRDVINLLSQITQDSVVYNATMQVLCLQDSTPVDGVMEIITMMPSTDMQDNEDSIYDDMTLYHVYINPVSEMITLSDTIISVIDMIVSGHEVIEAVKVTLDILIRNIILPSIRVIDGGSYFKIGYVGREFILFASRGYLDGELLE